MKTKTVYLFDGATGESIGLIEASASPLEPGQYLEPVCSTPIAPPALAVNQVAVFTAGAWSIVCDFRGQTFYDKTTGAPVVINALGPVSANLGASLPESAIAAQHAAQKTAVLEQARDIRETVLNRLTGIQINTTDAPTIAAIQSARIALLDITADAGVLAATDGATTKAAVMAAWRTIALTLATAAPSAASVFVGLGM